MNYWVIFTNSYKTHKKKQFIRILGNFFLITVFTRNQMLNRQKVKYRNYPLHPNARLLKFPGKKKQTTLQSLHGLL